MSAAPYESLRDYHRPNRTGKKTRARNVEVEIDPIRVKAQSRYGMSTLTFFFWQAMLFGFFVLVTFGFSILLGSSMMENARRDKIRATERANIARDDMARLSGRMDRLTTMAAVDTWARARGFVPPHGVPADWGQESVVAQLD
jgi:hypothetical protein